jgi:hypothetical protein
MSILKRTSMSKVWDDKQVLKEYLLRAEKLTDCVKSIVILTSNLGAIFKACGEINADSYLENAFLFMSFLNLEIEALMDGNLVKDSREHLNMNEGYVSNDQRGSWKDKPLDSTIALTKVCYKYLTKIESSSLMVILQQLISTIFKFMF